MMAINAVQIHIWYQWEMRIYFNNEADLNLTITDIYNVPMLIEHISSAQIDCGTNLLYYHISSNWIKIFSILLLLWLNISQNGKF